MMKFNKNTMIEFVIIVLISTIMALVYNIVRADKLPFFPKSKEELATSDDELFSFTDKIPANAPILDTTTQNVAIDTVTLDSTSTALLDTATKVDSVPSLKDTTDFATLLSNAKKSSFGEYRTINYEQMKKIASDNSNNFLIIDARRAEPYSASHIGNAINICPYDSTNIVMDRVSALPQNKTIIVYCDGGDCDSSHEIANILQTLGFNKFYVYEGG